MQLDMQRAALGYDMDIPWVSRDKVHIEITYRVTNMSDDAGSFAIIVDGASEYTNTTRRPSRTALGGDDPIILPLITTVADTLEPGATYSGIVREDDFAEGELDLDALGRWNDADVASPTFAGVLINRSDVNPIGMNLVPAEPGRTRDGRDRRPPAEHRPDALRILRARARRRRSALAQ